MDRSHRRFAPALPAAALALWLLAGCEPPPNAKIEEAPRPRSTGIATPPLEVGATLPPLQAEGWINGPAPAPGEPGIRLLVVDVWAVWSPFCTRAAPELVRLHQKYAARGVAFVSLTASDQGVAESFVSRQSVPWPNGYGVRAETVAALGAGSGMMGPPDYEAAPTIYLVGPDARVVWSDGRSRTKSQDPDAWGRTLDDAIARALAAPEK